jgi:hypothetical protein
MKRTFCDRCDKQCVNTTVQIRIEVIHHTSDGKFVGEDDFKTIEVCLDCSNLIKEMVPQAFATMSRKDEMNEPMMAMTEAPVRVEERRH